MVVTTKQVEFNLNVVNFPNPYINIPTKQSYGDCPSQMVIFCDVNLLCEEFMENICKMNRTLMMQGNMKEIFRISLSKFG